MKIISFIETHQREVIEKILRHCGLWEGPLRTLANPRAPPKRGTRPDGAEPRATTGPRSRIPLISRAYPSPTGPRKPAISSRARRCRGENLHQTAGQPERISGSQNQLVRTNPARKPDNPPCEAQSGVSGHRLSAACAFGTPPPSRRPKKTVRWERKPPGEGGPNCEKGQEKWV